MQEIPRMVICKYRGLTKGELSSAYQGVSQLIQERFDGSVTISLPLSLDHSASLLTPPPRVSPLSQWCAPGPTEAQGTFKMHVGVCFKGNAWNVRLAMAFGDKNRHRIPTFICFKIRYFLIPCASENVNPQLNKQVTGICATFYRTVLQIFLTSLS